jgi:hypothetical protein
VFRLFFPIYFAYLLIITTYRMGSKKKRDKCAAHPPPSSLLCPLTQILGVWSLDAPRAWS